MPDEIEKVETPTEQPEETPEIVQPETPAIDTEALKESLRSEMQADFDAQISKHKEEITDKFATALGLKENVVEGDGRPVLGEGEQVTPEFIDKHIQWKEEQREKERLALVERQTAQEAADAEYWKQYETNTRNAWESQLNELREEGAIPPILDPNDDNDPGAKAVAGLFTKMNEVNAERKSKGLNETFNLHEVNHRFYKGSTDVAGADAPVLGKSIKADSGSSMSSFEDIRMSNMKDRR